jgi:hypothetical protein
MTIWIITDSVTFTSYTSSQWIISRMRDKDWVKEWLPQALNVLFPPNVLVIISKYKVFIWQYKMTESAGFQGNGS